ncbi:MAG TPA: carbon-nitrogen hydrolase, partial [Marinobacter sp.]|nr:carbon-nitrogen hydrolase [Marinobacter sp.]
MVSAKREQTAGCRIGVVQMVSTGDIEANLAQADTLLEEATAGGARIAVFPENFAVLATRQMQAQGQTEAGSHPRIRQWLSERARHHNLWIVGGSPP